MSRYASVCSGELGERRGSGTSSRAGPTSLSLNFGCWTRAGPPHVKETSSHVPCQLLTKRLRKQFECERPKSLALFEGLLPSLSSFIYRQRATSTVQSSLSTSAHPVQAKPGPGDDIFPSSSPTSSFTPTRRTHCALPDTLGTSS